MKALIQFTAVIILTILIYGCGVYAYKSPTQTPNFFTAKNDMEFGVSQAEMTKVHGAYAITDKWSVHAGIGGWQKTDTFKKISLADSYFYKTKKNEWNIGGGFFAPLGEKNIFEVQFGAGFVNYKELQSVGLDKSSFNEKIKLHYYNRFYIQPAIGRNGQYFDYGFSFRIQNVYYAGIKKSDMLYEPLLFTRFGYKNVKAMFQLGFVVPQKSTTYLYTIPQIGIGLYFQMNKKIKTKS